jgi:hypothetical protein
MGRGYGERPVKDGFAAIGWSSMGDLSKLPANREAFKKVVASTYPALKPGAIPVVAERSLNSPAKCRLAILSSIRCGAVVPAS